MIGKKKTTGWVGWVYFAGAMLLVLGGIHIVAGLTGIFSPDFYVATQTGHLLAFNYTAWGWAHLLIGLAALGVGVSLMLGKLWAQVVTVGLVVLGMIIDLALIGTYPLWSITSLIIGGLIIYAVTLHGDELKQ